MAIKKAKKLDKRFSGSYMFKYYAEPDGNLPVRYWEMQLWREWCWEQFGPGTERDTALRSRHERDWRWAWDTEHGNCRIYFKGDEELSWFTLKWQ